MTWHGRMQVSLSQSSVASRSRAKGATRTEDPRGTFTGWARVSPHRKRQCRGVWVSFGVLPGFYTRPIIVY